MKRLLIAVVALAAVIAVIYWPKKAAPPPPPAPVLVKFNPDSVQKIQITAGLAAGLAQPGQPPVVLTRNGADWKLDQPYVYPADAASVTGMLGTLANITGAQDVGSSANAAAFGFDHPSQITLDLSPGAPVVFQFGADSPTGGNTYLRVGNSGEAEMVPSYVKENALKSPFLLQDKKILHFQADQLTGLEASSGAKKVSIPRVNNAWPKDSQQNVQTLLDALQDGQMTAMPDPSGKAAAQEGLAHPAATLRLTWSSGSAELEIGAKKGAAEYYARAQGNPAVFTLSDYLLTDITNLVTPPKTPPGS